MFRQLREWRAQKEQANQALAASETRIVDIAKRISRLEAEVELAERAAQRKRAR